MKFNVGAMLSALPKAMIGWLGVFAVTLIIIAVVWLLEKTSSGRE